MGVTRTTKKQINVRIFYAEEFKKARVADFESGKFTIIELGRLFGIKTQLIYRWIYKYSVYNKKNVKIIEMSESSTMKLKDMQLRIKELEQIVGQKQIMIDYLEKMIELASQEYEIDIKKNSGTKQSGGLLKTNTKQGIS